MKIDPIIGTTFTTPKGGTITVTGVYGKTDRNVKLYSCVCSICSQDKELFPDGIKSRKHDITKRFIPCGCSNFPRWSKSQLELRTKRACKDAGYKFIGFTDGEISYKSKFKYLCPDHGEQEMLYSLFVNNNKRCPGCARHGYNKNKPGTFYFIKYDHNGMVFYKYGITNRKTEKRITEHLDKSVSEFVNYEILYSNHFDDGRIPPSMEEIIKNKFRKHHIKTPIVISGKREVLNIDISDFIKSIYKIRS